jgi:myo-inositol-1(or 4)-monophosphatase
VSDHPFSDRDLDELLDAATVAARAGGDVVAGGFGRFEQLRSKGVGDWVTEIDTASEEAIRLSLATLAPDVAFFGEETGVVRDDVSWVVDPLDGTTNFVHGFPVVAVSIGLVAHGQPLVGVVHAPMLGTTFTARVGGGAHRDGTRMRVTDREPSAAVVATGFPFRKRDLHATYLDLLGDALGRFEDLRRAGAASLDLAWTAAGVFDGYFEPRLGPWDVAAGALLVREAGGVVTAWDGDVDTWLTTGNVVAGGPAVHAALADLVAGAAV